MNIFVGNLSRTTNDQDLERKFSSFGTVTSCKVIKDMQTGQSKGFGFVEMPNTSEATKAMHELNSSELDGRKLTVNEAKPKTNSGGSRNSFAKRW